MDRQAKSGRPKSKLKTAKNIATDTQVPCSARFSAILLFEREGGSKEEVVSLLWRVLEDAVTGTVKTQILEKLQAIDPDPGEATKVPSTSAEFFALAAEYRQKGEIAYKQEFHQKFGEDLLGGLDEPVSSASSAMTSPVVNRVPTEPDTELARTDSNSSLVEAHSEEAKPVRAKPSDEPEDRPTHHLNSRYQANKHSDANYLSYQRPAVSYRPPDPGPCKGYEINFGVKPVVSLPSSPAGPDPWLKFRENGLNAKE